MIYFIEGCNEHGEPLVKVGFTAKDSPEQRLKACQTGSPVQLALLGHTQYGTRNMEAMFHKRFRKHHSHLEWFHLEPIQQELDSLIHRPRIIS